jgi:hypothetical protein
VTALTSTNDWTEPRDCFQIQTAHSRGSSDRKFLLVNKRKRNR